MTTQSTVQPAKPAAAAALLDVRGLSLASRQNRSVVLLDDVDLQVAAGEVHAIVGESGCGKTMTCLTLLGLQPHSVEVTGGRALFDGVDLLAASEPVLERLRGRRIAMIFQDPASALNPVHRIGDVLARSLMRHRALDKSAASAEACRLLEQVRIPQPKTRLNAYPHEMSGGMNQRVMIALALTGNPALLIADEPTTALDVTMQRQILDLLAEIRSETGMAMVFISHDLGVVAQLADRISVMYCGRVVEQTAPDALYSAPLHPYSAGLMDSMPPDPRAPSVASARPIRGMAASFSDLPAGCHFHPRCDTAQPRCRTQRPPQFRGDGGHLALCHHPLRQT